MKNKINVEQIVDLFIVTPNYQLKDNSGVTEMLKNYTVGKQDFLLQASFFRNLSLMF